MSEKKFKPGMLVKHKAQHVHNEPPIMAVVGYAEHREYGFVVTCRYWNSDAKTFTTEIFVEDELKPI